MTQAAKNKTELEKFLRDVQTYQTILAMVEEFQKNTLKNETLLQKFQQDLETSIKQLHNIENEELPSLLDQIKKINHFGKYDGMEAEKLKTSLHWLMQKKSQAHQPYIENRVSHAEKKAQKAIQAMPSKANRYLVKSAEIAYHVSTAAEYTGAFLFTLGFVSAMAILALCVMAFVVLPLPMYIAAGICGAGIAIMAIAGIPAFVSWCVAKSQKEKYNQKITRAQKTLDRAIQFEDTYNFLTVHGLTKEISLEDPLLANNANDPLLFKPQKSVFSIKKALEERSMPLLNEVKDTQLFGNY